MKFKLFLSAWLLAVCALYTARHHPEVVAEYFPSQPVADGVGVINGWFTMPLSR